jgi:hypothetical protein
MNAEQQRLFDDREKKVRWKRWGPYVSERQWGTVREDYSANGTAWESFPHDHARSRAYRWGEDGIAGISDSFQRLCFSVALWNGRDPILKERLFGLTGNEGNHGEDVKECYFYLDNTPTHSYMKYLYKYPQKAFPYDDLLQENRRRGRNVPEYELLDTGIFQDNRYYDVVIEYAKAGIDDILIKISVTNHGPDDQLLHLFPTLWFRNTWSWANETPRPQLSSLANNNLDIIEASHPTLGKYWLSAQKSNKVLFTENETNVERLYGMKGATPYFKDSINDYVIHGKQDAINPKATGTKAALHYILKVDSGKTVTVQLRLSDKLNPLNPLGDDFKLVFDQRLKDADEFYANLSPYKMSDDEANIQRQALAGMLWTKQYYCFNVDKWLNGDASMPKPAESRKFGRNRQWLQLDAENILSMPDKWEYPWFASWDMAFHAIALATVDPDFAKEQLDVLTREWYMHPNGQIPAYEWQFGDVNPPVHAWAALRVYHIEEKIYGKGDRKFLERVFQKLLLNFTWWVNRKDQEGNNVFEGGFLGLDNVGIFDRSSPLPTGGFIEQADGTSWMGMYSLNMLAIALELALDNEVYEDIATKFFEHFIYIAEAINKGNKGVCLWDEEDGFYYDVLDLPDGSNHYLKTHSIVGLIPLFAIQVIDPEILEALPAFKKRLEWFVKNRPELRDNVACMETPGLGARRLLSIVNEQKLRRILAKMLDEKEFLSSHGIRSLSKYHQEHPYTFSCTGTNFSIDYEPAESTSGLFGGNSNWRGPVWFPVNFLLIESLQRFDYYYGDKFTVEYPVGSGQQKNLWDIATDLSKRLTGIFLKGPDGSRPANGLNMIYQEDPRWSKHILFFEYFHGDTGAGIGASHQTGWSGLAAKLIQQLAKFANTKNDRGLKVNATAPTK